MNLKLKIILLVILFPIIGLAQIDGVQSIQKINNVLGGLTGTPLGAIDRFGHAVEVIGDVDGDGIIDVAVGAYLDDGSVSDRGAVYILMLNADGTVKNQQKISDISGNGPSLSLGRYFGSDIAALGDLNGDGNVDIAVGAYGCGDEGTSSYRGAVYILFLNNDGTVLESQKISDNEGGGPGNLVNNDYFGVSVSNIGDLNGDGLPDLAIHASGDDDGGSNIGAVYIGFLDVNGTLKEIHKISATTGGFTGTLTGGDGFGNATSIGDMDGDGIIDIAVGAYSDDDGGTDRGAIWVLFMNNEGTVKSSQKISDTVGNFTGVLGNSDNFGVALTGVGDLDGDGINDLIVGALLDDDGPPDAGALWILYMNSDGTVKNYGKISGTDPQLVNQFGSADRFGCSVSYYGDRNNDGRIDLLVGAWNAYDSTPTKTGEVYILHLEGTPSYPNKEYLSAKSIIASAAKNSAATTPLNTLLEAGDYFGISSDGIGDLDGDGIGDVVVGTHGDDDGGTMKGAVYIQFLNADGTIKSYQKISYLEGNFTTAIDNYDYFGIGACHMGYINGYSTIAVGATGDDDGGTHRGAVWIISLETNGEVHSYQKISATQGGFTGTLSNADFFGANVANIGDLDGNGINELAVGAIGDDDGGTDVGAVWILFLDSNKTVISQQKISATDGNLTETLTAGEKFCRVASIGDLNQDGVPDIVVGAHAADDGGTDVGAIYVLNLTDTGTVKSSQKITKNKGGFKGWLNDGDYFGVAVTGGYDFNQDGIKDILVGSTGADHAGLGRGTVWMLYMNSDGTVKEHQIISSSSNHLTELIDDSDAFGRSLGIVEFDSNTAKIVVGGTGEDDGGSNAGVFFLLELDLSALKDFNNDIVINTNPIEDGIPYDLSFQGQNYGHTTGGTQITTVANSTTTQTAKITVAQTSSYDALELFFDVNQAQISNVRILTDTLIGADTLLLDSTMYRIVNDGHELILFQGDTTDLPTDSIAFGFVLEGGLGFSPNGNGGYEVLEVEGLENIYQFDLTINTLADSTVFYTIDKNNFWDGKYQGTSTLVPSGVYKYIAIVNGQSFEGQIIVDTTVAY